MTPTSATQEEALWPGVHACRLAEQLLHGYEPLASNGKLWLGSSGLQRSLPPPARRHLLPSTLACAVWLLVAALFPCSLLALSSQKASFCIASLIISHLGLDRQAGFLPETLLTFRFLFYREPGSDEIREIPTAINGTLEDLRQLSERLAKEYAWTAADATLFVLTNTAPEIRPLTSTSQSRQLPALSRIVLTIDPALSPQEVAEHYRQIRQEIMPARHRDLSEKHLQLAAFSGTHPRLGTWQQKMVKWNSEPPRLDIQGSIEFCP